MQANNQAVARQIQRTGQQDTEQLPFLLESFAIELMRKRTVPIIFASCGDEEGNGTAVIIVMDL